MKSRVEGGNGAGLDRGLRRKRVPRYEPQHASAEPVFRVRERRAPTGDLGRMGGFPTDCGPRVGRAIVHGLRCEPMEEGELLGQARHVGEQRLPVVERGRGPLERSEPL